jgi:hypothetical protein
MLDDHLRLRSAGQVKKDLARNYAPDVVLLCEPGVLQGVQAASTVSSSATGAS